MGSTSLGIASSDRPAHLCRRDDHPFSPQNEKHASGGDSLAGQPQRAATVYLGFMCTRFSHTGSCSFDNRLAKSKKSLLKQQRQTPERNESESLPLLHAL
ncbi:hypothetical protein [Brevibacillus porteri]|uniref:hypothetical protein n=1 Tax=Brevibacillus porteri TaxID=2126350 RepID=UPI003D250CCD